jgi:sulfur carrier protein ThiS
MRIKVKLDLTLQQVANEREIVEVTGTTVSECLSDLIRQCPPIQKWLIDESGSILPTILINGEVLPPERTYLAVRDGDELSLMNLLEGG